MCTSFVWRKGSVLAAMNFDNNGMPFAISTKDPKRFTVLVDGGRGKYPSFGVNGEGTFINNLLVDSNGKGLYKRASTWVTHTSRLTGDILSGEIPPEDISSYIRNIEVVNGPDFSVHNMISDGDGNVWVVEPGRGNICSPAGETPYFVMTNFSLWDFKKSGKLGDGGGADRYQAASALLDRADGLDVRAAFQVLDAVKQSGGEWTTALSMVYSQADNAVYYCFDRDFTNISKRLLIA